MIDLLKTYLEHRFKVMGVRAQYYSTVLMAVLIQLLILGAILLAALLLLGMAAGFAIGAWVGSIALGMLSAAGLYIIIAIIFYFCRAYLLERFQRFVDKRLSHYLAHDDVEDE